MLPRSNTRPMLTALGAATVISLGAVAVPAPALATDPAPTASEDPAPDPSSDPPSSPPAGDPPPTKTPPPATTPPYTPPPHTPPPGTSDPVLSMVLALSPGTALPGGSVLATVTMASRPAVAHHTVLRVSAPSARVAGPPAIGDLSAERTVTAVVTIPAGHAAGTVSVTASLSADHASTRRVTRKITVVLPGTPGAAGAAGAMAAADLPSGLSVPGFPGALTALGAPGQAQLPLIAGQQPAVAPDGSARTDEVALRGDASRLGLDEASYRLLWTQVAWLAALLVGVSLLLTQMRLKRRAPVRRAARRR